MRSVLALTFLLFFAAFTNCSSPERVFRSSPSSFSVEYLGGKEASGIGFPVSPADPGGGNGQGYGGKPYIEIVAAACADGSQVKSRLRVTAANQAYVERKNCEDLAAPVLLSITDWSVSALDSSLLIWDEGGTRHTLVEEVGSPIIGGACNPVEDLVFTGSRLGVCNFTATSRVDKSVDISLDVYSLGGNSFEAPFAIACYLQQSPSTLLEPLAGVAGGGVNRAGRFTADPTRITFRLDTTTSVAANAYNLRCSVFRGPRPDLDATTYAGEAESSAVMTLKLGL